MDSRQEYADVAVLVPCYNEEPTIEKVVRDFKQDLPGAQIYVFDNNSTDRTAERARHAGAKVVLSARQGKGNVVRHMFDVIQAKYYVMVDGDDTYPSSAAPELVQLAKSSGAAMIVGARLNDREPESFRRFHQAGNVLLARLLSSIFRTRVTDVLSGYRVFSSEFVNTVPLISQGFEIETELTLQSVAKNFVIREHPIKYGSRKQGSYSKLNTYRDGVLILKLVFMLFRDYKPLTFFSLIGLMIGSASLMAGLPSILDYYHAGKVYHLPRAVLAAGLGVVAVMSVGLGIVLHTIRNYHNENFELWRKVIKRIP